MFSIIRQIFLKGGTIKDAIAYVFKATGKMPNKSDGQKLINIYKDVQKNTGKVIEFPKDRITPFYKPRPGEGVSNTKQRIFQIDDELDNLVAKEGKYGKMNRKDRENLMIRLQDESSTLQKTPGVAEGKFNDEFRSFKLNIAKNNPEFNQDLAKQVINREMFKDATTEQRKQVLDALEFVLKNPEGLASGGLARVGMFGGGPIRLAKGAAWVINKLKEQLFDIDLGIGGSRFSKISSTQKEMYKNELKTLIKQLEQGGEIPNEMLDTMIADPKFKSVVKTRSTDKDLFELEGALLDRQAGKQADQIVDDVFGPLSPEEIKGKKLADSMSDAEIELRGEFPRLSDEKIDNILTKDLFDADGKLNKKAVLQEVKDSEEKMLLDKFDVKDRKPNASGGIAGQLHMNQGGRASFTKGGKVSSGLANILGV